MVDNTLPVRGANFKITPPPTPTKKRGAKLREPEKFFL
jgi:hypothetical protein